MSTYDSQATRPAPPANECGSCGVPVDGKLALDIRRLIAMFGEKRLTFIAADFGGTAPSVLCAACFVAVYSRVATAMPGILGVVDPNDGHPAS